uniref:Uncharacterized protein n=1 Tax=Avena sativa TaxID=4498 RepID=A0ACD5X495_AVESA
MAPMLKKFNLSTYIHKDCSMSFSAPMAEYISWDCSYGFENVGIGENWRLRNLDLWMKENICILSLSIYASESMPDADRNFSQEIAPLPAFSVLKLYLAAREHTFGAMVLSLLRICSTVQRLVIVTSQLRDEEGCPPNCPCDQPQNWRSETISLIALEEVEIEGFGGADHEIDFLMLLFRCARMMKRLSVRMGEVSPSHNGCKKMYSILKANPDVKCSVHQRCGKQVMYA